jgi:hypothetical protein
VQRLARGLVAALGLSLAGAPLGAGAGTLTFDDITTEVISGAMEDLVPPYGGFTWSEFWRYAHEDLFTGPQDITSSGSYAVYNIFGADVDMSVGAGETFDFIGAYFTALWRNDLQITVTGLLDGSQVYSQTVTVQATGQVWYQFDYDNIDELTFDSFGGTNAGYGNDGVQFALDDFTFVPEPNSFALVGGGLVVFGLFQRRRR